MSRPVDPHATAVTNTLGWADEAAADGRYAEALSWLLTIEAIGDALPAEYRRRRSTWTAAALRGDGAAVHARRR